MPPTNQFNTGSANKGTRYQPKALYIAAAVFLSIATLYNVSEQFADDWLGEATCGLYGDSPVKWRTREAAMLESKMTHKPVLYVFLSRRDQASLQMFGGNFHDSQVAALINENFIPVRSVHSTHQHEQLNAVNKELDNQYSPTSTELLVVPSHMLELSRGDLQSTANLSELGMNNTSNLESGNRYSYTNYNSYNGYGKRYHGDMYSSAGVNGGPRFIGNGTKEEVLDYLYEARFWHELPPTRGKVNWQAATLANKPFALDSAGKYLPCKPRLIAFVDNVGAASDNLRLDTFWNRLDYRLINREFEPVLVEFHHGDAKFNKDLELLQQKYGITNLPALVIDSPALPAPLTQFGHANSANTREFIHAAVKKLSTSPPNEFWKLGKEDDNAVK